MYIKKQIKNLFILCVISLLVMTSVIVKADTSQKGKTGILLVSFGSSYAETRKTFHNIEMEIKKAFPQNEIYWAYTSRIIRKKLRSRGEQIYSPAEALALMGEKGFTKVAVQSLHVIPGEEYENLLKTVAAFDRMPKGVQSVVLGKPLMFHNRDIKSLTDVLMTSLPEELSQKEAVVFMGHGTHHQSNAYYPAMQYYMWQRNPSCFLATVEGYPELDNVITYLEKGNYKKVWLLPFMTIAGDHACNDMAGKESDSWRSVLKAKGYDVECVLKGMATHKGVVDIWIQHLKKAFEELN